MRFDRWIDLILSRFIVTVRNQIDRRVLTSDTLILEEKQSWPILNGGPPDGFGVHLRYTKKELVLEESFYSLVKPSLPRYFYIYKDVYLKIPHKNDLVSILYHWCLGVGGYGSVVIWTFFNALLIYLFAFKAINVEYGSMIYPLAIESFLLLIFLFEGTAASKIIDTPYCIFDNSKKSLIICGSKMKSTVPYDLISFNLIEIQNSSAYCAIELNINLPGQPAEKMVTDICASHPQALSILKTYFMILKGDETIRHIKLKPHPALLSEFCMPMYKGAWHFYCISQDWFKCVVPHYIAFRWSHGHPIGVLKKYIIEQELKKPLKIK
jgi:hypothetical protein